MINTNSYKNRIFPGLLVSKLCELRLEHVCDLLRGRSFYIGRTENQQCCNAIHKLKMKSWKVITTIPPTTENTFRVIKIHYKCVRFMWVGRGYICTCICVLNAIYNNISVISLSVFLWLELPTYWKSLANTRCRRSPTNLILFEFVIVTDCTCRCKYTYHMIYLKHYSCPFFTHTHRNIWKYAQNVQYVFTRASCKSIHCIPSFISVMSVFILRSTILSC